MKSYAKDVDQICDDVVFWPSETGSRWSEILKKGIGITASIPIPVIADRSEAAIGVIRSELEREIAVVVFDFPHSAVLAPGEINCPSVMFTHNIEAEIFKRHLEVANTPVHRWLWQNQYRKMLQFEKEALNAFDTVIAVSERDCEFFRSHYDVETCETIPTGVDISYFDLVSPCGNREVVFCGSMDWLANIDGIEWFFDNVWSEVVRRVPDARMKVVGRAPPDSLVSRITTGSPEWTFTGFVDDVRPHVNGADAFVIPLRVGGGTRIKAFEAMAMGAPVVSTAVGIEGLDVEDGQHYLRADSADEFAVAVVSLLTDHHIGAEMSARARMHVKSKFSHRRAATEFERICSATADSVEAAALRN